MPKGKEKAQPKLYKNEKSEVYKNPIFKFLVITRAGVPIFEFPMVEEQESMTVLLSGFLSAINSFAKELSGDNIEEITIGGHKITISQSKKEDKLFILWYDTGRIPDESVAKQIHLEITALYENYFKDDDYTSIQEKDTRSIFEPFYSYWMNRIKQSQKGTGGA